MILLDYNEELSLHLSRQSPKDLPNSEKTVRSVQTTAAKVQINTLSSYINFGGGVFVMSDVKRMTAKDDFLKMELKDRNCEVELYEDCRTRKLLEKCNCVPWEIFGIQVTN